MTLHLYSVHLFKKKKPTSPGFTKEMKEELYKIGQEVNRLMQDPSVPNEFKLQGFRLNLYKEWKTVVAQTHPLFDASAVSPSSIGARYAGGGGSQFLHQ